VAAEHYPLLVEACRTVASHQLRSRATIAGNICNASPAGDTIGACLVLDAYLTVHGVDGFRQEPLATFFLGPGKTTLKAGDIVTSVVFPLPPTGGAGKYFKLGRNLVGDLAIVGVSVFGFPDPGKTSGYCFRIALASVAPVPLRATAAERILANQPINETTIATAAVAAMQACNPIDDVRGSARYRKLMVRNLTRMAVSQVFQQLTGQA
jgi:carbon-monoxide dehydrogenase medium subunit